MNNKVIKNIAIFIVSFLLYYIMSMPSRILLQIYTVTDVRFSAVLNPVLSMAFGYPAIIGCTIGNFVCDIIGGYGVMIAFVGIVPQFLYGFIPYFLWKKTKSKTKHRTRLDTPGLLIKYTLIMLINSIIIGINVGWMVYLATHSDLVSAAKFAALNDFVVCMVLGMPLMVLLEYMYDVIVNKENVKISLNEKIILINVIVQIVGSILIAIYYSKKYMTAKLVDTCMNAYKTIFVFVNAMVVVSILLVIIVSAVRESRR